MDKVEIYHAIVLVLAVVLVSRPAAMVEVDREERNATTPRPPIPPCLGNQFDVSELRRRVFPLPLAFVASWRFAFLDVEDR